MLLVFTRVNAFLPFIANCLDFLSDLSSERPGIDSERQWRKHVRTLSAKPSPRSNPISLTLNELDSRLPNCADILRHAIAKTDAEVIEVFDELQTHGSTPVCFPDMDTPQNVKNRLRAELPELRKRYAVERLGLCGSFVRGDQTTRSDVDLLVTFSETPDLLEFVNLKRHLEDVLGREVDLGMPSALKKGPAANNIRNDVEYL